MKRHKDNTKQDLTKKKSETSHLLVICYSIVTTLNNVDINLTGSTSV